ncbi:MAG: ankyrin repeat domain-containing protein [Phycisphaerales bacterium]|nr:ankyrin repeat domain-containing protein [Phycisphaerales bacterium]
MTRRRWYSTIILVASTLGGCSGPYGRGWGDAPTIARAAYSGDLDSLRDRLDAGDSAAQAINVPTYDFAAGNMFSVETPLSLAVLGREREAVRLLLARGAPIESRVLPAAVEQGPAMVAVFLEAGLNPNMRIDQWPMPGGTALHWAAYYRKPEAVGLLLGAGADPRLLDEFGRSPLSLVSQRQGADSRASRRYSARA